MALGSFIDQQIVTQLQGYSYTRQRMEVTQKPQLHNDWIDPHAYGIVKALQKGGFETYLVGGCVRDLLVGIHPKDFDIATDAPPQQVKRLIYQSYIIGKRFRLVLVKRDEQQFEVATFRREVKAEEFPEGVPFGDNVFGTPEEDAKRRDFTINALFYDPIDNKLIDYIDGMKDIEARVLRMIGDPGTRLIEDPIRILRALRLAHKINFKLDPDLRAAIQTHSPELLKSVLPRRREEILKILRLDEPELLLLEAFDLDVLKYTLPTLHELFQNAEHREIFIEHFKRNHRLAPASADTVHLFAWIMYSLFQTVMETQDIGDRRGIDVVEGEKFQAFMRDELGMFKFEQLTATKAIELLSAIGRVDDYKKRGERRQLALVKNEGFDLALRMAEVDYLVPPEDLQFWYNLRHKFAQEITESADDERDKRRSTSRNRRRGGARRERGPRGENASDATDESQDETDNETRLDAEDQGAEQSEAKLESDDNSLTAR